ncbi:MAG: PilZ domain-containing protein [Nitrospirae bacterium]|nr:PilZ domain-containing protein [Nitrospirota bacterium]
MVGQGIACESVLIYRAGIKFTDVSTDKLNELIDFIGSHKSHDYAIKELHKVSGQGLNARFQIDTSTKTILSIPLSFRLKKVSLSSMLIECEHELDIEARLRMKMSLPGGKFISFRGKVAYCLKTYDGSTAPYNIGIQFIDMPQKDKEKLKEFVRVLEKNDDNSSFFSAFENC